VTVIEYIARTTAIKYVDRTIAVTYNNNKHTLAINNSSYLLSEYFYFQFQISYQEVAHRNPSGNTAKATWRAESS
jgi:hypothetical protein